MYERVSYPKTPRWARHLSRLSQLMNIPINENVSELAQTYTFDESVLPLSPVYSKRERDALQYILDFDGRCLVLDPEELSLSRHVLVTAVKILGSKRILLSTPLSKQISEWNKILATSAPNDAIVNLSDPSYNRGNPETADRVWILARNKHIETTTVSEYKIDHFISDQPGLSTQYDFEELEQGLALEIHRTTCIGVTINFWNKPEDPRSSNVISNISNKLIFTLRLSPNVAKILYGDLTPETHNYFKTRGTKYDSLRIMETIGVCTGFAIDPSSLIYTCLTSSSMLVPDIGDNSKRRNEVIERYKRHEEDTLESLGSSMSEVVDQATQGNADCIDALEGLKTSEWAKLKSHMFHKHMFDNKRVQPVKTIILARNPALRRCLLISLMATELKEGMNPTTRNEILANFSYPSKHCRSFDLPSSFSFKALSTILLDSYEDLDDRILSVVDRVVVAEYETDPVYTEGLIELSRIYGFKIIFGTMRGTFEEHLSTMLLK